MTVDNAPHTSVRSRRRGAVVGYDFSAPAGLSREHTRLLEVAFETFARQWTTQLASRLRCSTEVTLTSLEQQTYDTYAADLVAPTVLVTFATESFGTGLLQMSVPTALQHLDHALGGRGAAEQPTRQLTDIEVAVTQGMCERALGTLGYAFASVAPVEPRVDGFHQDPQLLQAAKANDMVVVATFELRMEDDAQPATLMLPLAPILQRLTAGDAEDTRTPEEIERARAAAAALQASLPEVPVDVALRLAPTTAAPHEVLALGVGDLLRLPHPATSPLEVVAEGVVVARAVTTARGNRRAGLIVSTEEDHR
ncbi:flagellar motor switch protein FliM [Thalassiella azotivora]